MCGISGIIKFNNKVRHNEIETFSNYLFHRGPNSSGVWINKNENVALGHRRLSILDLSISASQPMSFDDYQIVFNGEIYNFIEIKNELENCGFKFSTNSDTEVILKSYKKWGDKMLDKFNGMWAIAIYNEKKDELFLSRDRFGIKPLYYYLNEDVFIFSSEIQAIHKFLGNNTPLNREVLKNIANGDFSHHGTDQTYLENTHSLLAGHNLIYRNKQIIKYQWYSIKKVSVPKEFDEQAKILRNLICDSCKLRLRSDVPVGTCLSGGLDSSSIVGVINNYKPDYNSRFNNYKHHSFCATFKGTPIDESTKAEKVAKKFNLELNTIDIKAPTEKELVNFLLKCDGPMNSLAFYPITKLYEKIKKENITVTLDGQGPDEMLGGYRPLSEALTTAFQKRKFKWFWDIYKTYSNQGESAQFSAKKNSRKTLFLFAFQNMKKILKDILVKFKLLKTHFNDYGHPIFIKSKLDISLYKQFFFSPLPGILQQYDRCSMSNGVECRMPFMDYRIVEFIFSLPEESKIGNGYTKRVLREAMKGIVPDDTRLDKHKLGFNAPIVDWFKGELKNFMLKQMDTKEFENSEFFDAKTIKKQFNKFILSKEPQWDTAWKFWGPVHLTWWLNELKK